MPSWLDPTSLGMVIGVASLAVAFGLIRREPPWAIVGLAAGVALFLIAMRWAISIGRGAEGAVLLGALGFGLWLLAIEQSRRTIDSHQKVR